MRREWLVFIAVAAIFFFASATTFQSLGIVAFAMQGEFKWSEAATGGSFLSLGLVCAVTSMLPVVLIPRIGGRRTVVTGSLILALGFFVAYLTRGLATFYVAAGLFGLAFSLVANTCGIYLTASWFGARSPRMIGLYLMAGTLGGVVGPPVAQAIVSSGGGWRLHWLAMTAVAAGLAALCAVFIRNPPSTANETSADQAHAEWEYRGTVRTPQFAVIALSMVVTQICLLTVSGVTPSHFSRLGWPDGFAAEILAFQALIATVATGLSGWLSERFDPKLMLAVGLLIEALGMILLAVAHTVWIAYGFVLVFGIGQSVASLAVTVLLVRYFGNTGGAAALSAIWMVSGIAAAGPSAAGYVADLTGSFAPALSAFGLLLLPIAAAALFMTAPRALTAEGLVPEYSRD